MSKIDNFEQLKGDYQSAYEMVNKKPCPDIVKAKAWIKVGDVSFRPDDFEKSLRTLQLRCSNDNEKRQDVENKLTIDSDLLNQAKISLTQSLEKLKQLTICEGSEIENIKEMLEKCENLIDVSKKRNVI